MELKPNKDLEDIETEDGVDFELDANILESMSDDIKTFRKTQEAFTKKANKAIKIYRLKRLVRVIFLCSIIFGFCVFGLTVGFLGGNKDKEKPNDDYQQTASKNDGVMLWLRSFATKDYTSCDKLVSNSQNKLSTSNLIYYVDDLDDYTYMLNKLVDSVTSMKIDTKTELADGSTQYKVNVYVKPYKSISSLDVSEAEVLNDLVKGYIEGSIGVSEFKSELSIVYSNIFKNNCFIEDDENTLQCMVLTLSEKQEEDGVTYVYNIGNFIDELLSDSNIKNNIQVYETDVKSDVNNKIVTPY